MTRIYFNFIKTSGLKISKASRVRHEPGSGSSDQDPSKKLIKTQNAYDSGSGRDPDPWIGLQIMRIGPDSDFRIRTQEFYARMKREPGSGPVKKFIKTRNAYNSRSGRDPDPRIERKNNTNESEFCFPNPDSIILGPSKTYTRIRILGSGPRQKIHQNPKCV